MSREIFLEMWDNILAGFTAQYERQIDLQEFE